MNKILTIIICLLFLFLPNATRAEGEKESFYISSKTIINGDYVYVGSNYKISNLKFIIGTETQEKTCPSDFFCKIKIQTKNRGDQVLKINKNNFETKNIKILSEQIKKPSIYTKKIKLNKENKFLGKNLTKTVKLHTSFGIFEAQTNKKTFKLKILTSLTSLPEDLKKSPIYIENEDGAISDIIIAKYEI